MWSGVHSSWPNFDADAQLDMGLHGHAGPRGPAPDDRKLPLQVLHVLHVPAAGTVLRLLRDAQADPPHLTPEF